jgi:hypothetical protein
LVSKLCPDANRYEPPPPYAGKGRPRGKGPKLPKPREAVALSRPASRSRLRVAWYGGGTRRVRVLTGTGHWYKSGRGRAALRWVFVEDRTGTHREEYLFTTDRSLTPAEVIGLYCGRWNIETTFQECRSGLGRETTRGWCRRTVLRAAPCLFGLYSVVALIPGEKLPPRAEVDRPGRLPSTSPVPPSRHPPAGARAANARRAHRRARTATAAQAPPTPLSTAAGQPGASTATATASAPTPAATSSALR